MDQLEVLIVGLLVAVAGLSALAQRIGVPYPTGPARDLYALNHWLADAFTFLTRAPVLRLLKSSITPLPPLNRTASSRNGSSGEPQPVISETVPVPTWLPAGQALAPELIRSLSLAVHAGIAWPSNTVLCGQAHRDIQSASGLPLERPQACAAGSRARATRPA